jgi:hypothetical protein
VLLAALTMPSNTVPRPSIPFGIGFPRTHQSFDATVRYHRFLYRVHNTTSDSPLDDELGFIATTFQRNASDSTLLHLRRRPASDIDDLRDKAVKHVGRCSPTVSSSDMSAMWSPFVSTSFSLPYALWEASRRSDSSISIIDGHMLLGCAWLALELLGVQYDTERHLANESQEVLVWANVPRKAILASSPWKMLLNALPPWAIDLKYHIRFHRYTTSRQCCNAFINAAASTEDDSDLDSPESLSEVVEKAMILMADAKANASNSTTRTELRYHADMVTDFATYLHSWPTWIRGELMSTDIREAIGMEVKKELNVHQHRVRIKETNWMQKELRGVIEAQLEDIELEAEEALELDCR